MNLTQYKNYRFLKKILLIFVLVFPFVLKAQVIKINEDSGISDLTKKYTQANAKIKTMMGFRVQIFFDSGNNSRNAAENARAKFKGKFPTIPAYLTFKEPNFRVRVGDFRSRHEARGFLKKIQLEYPNAFVIKDEINLPGLSNSNMDIDSNQNNIEIKTE